ncbi:MAG: dicarboxylate/amino acid:cation symporter [Pseudomonadota bacterium]|nr:dicarboxylate/amino acid:cation symporter [Pseudomonadota bacterium]MDE3037238.1 dicarboxylate/amino acid:cation symporter [Pseudomonadota bacterium]
MAKLKSLFDTLWFRVLLGLVLGIAFGFAVGPVTAHGALGIDGKSFLTEYIRPVGTVFINLIKMVIVPLIFFSLISGIVSMTDAKAFRRIGLKSVAYYLTTGAFAVCIGLAFGHFFRPGLGVDLSALAAVAGTPAAPAAALPPVNVISILVGTIPPNVVKAMAEDNILQVVVFALFVGITLNALGDKVRNLTAVFQQSATLVFRLIETVIRFSPYGVFALTAWMVGTQGLDILFALFKLVCVVIGALFTQYLLFGLMLVAFGRLSPLPFYKKMLEPQLMAFSTSSSKATLPVAMRVVNESIGVSKSNTAFVLPLGASINMDGTAIYLGITALFFSQAYGIPLGPHQYFILVLTATLGSIGAAGIPSGSLFMMGMVFTSVGLPLDGIALIAGIDRILDMMRTTVNITGDSLITLLVDKSEATFNRQVYEDMSR